MEQQRSYAYDHDMNNHGEVQPALHLSGAADEVTRRRFLAGGVLALGSLSLPGAGSLALLAAEPRADGVPAARARDLSVETLDIGSRRELFVDRYLIEKMDGLTAVLQRPIDGGIALEFDKPWEGPSCAYCTVLKDGPIYRLYYRGQRTYTLGDGEPTEVTCYAESRDGITWTKPALGLFEVNGTRENNVILDSSFAPACHNFSPFLDTRPGVPAAERYKALGGLFNQMRPGATIEQLRADPSVYGPGAGLRAFVSPDGIRWKQLREQGVITRENNPVEYNDTAQSPAFWSEAEGCYVCYIRAWKSDGKPLERAGWGGNLRWIGRVTSPDFVNWSKMELMDDDGAPLEQLYTNQTGPYFRAPHLYVSLAARFVIGRRLLTKEQGAAIQVDPRQMVACSDAVLLTSRGGNRYDRTFMEGFVRPEIGLENWTARTNYPALNVVPTGPTEMSLYVQRHYAQPSHHLHRYTLRTDGFASIHASYKGGELLTKPLRFAGKKLAINFATSAAGGLRVEIQDAAGNAIPRYSLENAREMIGNEIERVVT
jgi:hypothetical protein